MVLNLQSLLDLVTIDKLLIFVVFLRIYLKLTDSTYVPVPSNITSQLATAKHKGLLFHHIIDPVNGDRSSASHVIVMVHGFMQTHETWLRLAGDLHDQFPTAYVLDSINLIKYLFVIVFYCYSSIHTNMLIRNN